MVRKTLEKCGLSRAQIARDSELSEATLWSWWTGVRSPSSDSIRKLAAGLRARGAELERIADELDKAAQ